MKIGFITYEYFTAEPSGDRVSTTTAHGGFGYLTRKKCESLSKMGNEVHVFLPSPAFDRDKNVTRTLEINGVFIHLFKTTNFYQVSGIKRMLAQSLEYVKGVGDLEYLLNKYPVDIYQTEEPYIYTLQAMKNSNRHIVVFQDPLDSNDIEIMNSSLNSYLGLIDQELVKSSLYVKSRRYFGRLGSRLNNELFVRSVVKKTLRKLEPERVFAEANFISEKVSEMYKLGFLPRHLPNPVDVYGLPKKSDSPSVVWLNRWDPVKRPQVALEIARRFPEVDFYFIGKATGYPLYDKIEKFLRIEYSKFPNIKLKQFVTEEEKGKLLSQSWILLNTSAREGLPVTFLEAGSNGMTIISSVNPDNYTKMFGSTFKNIDDAVMLIKRAVLEEWHLTKGKLAYNYIRNVHETEKVMRKHERIYLKVLSDS